MENAAAFVVSLASLIGAIYAIVQGVRSGNRAKHDLQIREQERHTEAERIQEEITDTVLKRAKVEITELTKRITELESENARLGDLVGTLQTDYDILRVQHRNLEREYQSVRSANQSQRAQITNLKAENRKLKLRIDALEKGDTGPLKEH